MQNPFKFLDSFTRDDKDIFFGRDLEIDEIYHKVFTGKTLLVYGVSGTGKTSLINCGLANKFSDSDWLPINIRRGSNLTESIIQSLNNDIINPVPEGKGKDLVKKMVKILHSVYLDHFKPVYLIFDQFEELFILGTIAEKEEFINGLQAINASDIQCKIILVIREEYLAGITEFERKVPGILDNRIRVEKMARPNVRKAIEGPCSKLGMTVEDGFSDQLYDNLSNKSGEVELTYLQVALDKLYRESSDHAEKVSKETLPSFTLELLEQMGNISDILGSFLDEQISRFYDSEATLIILKSFVTMKGTKRQITETEVSEYSKTLGKNIPANERKQMLITLVNLRILRDKDENGRYELRHDALAAKIFEKITLFEKDLLEIRQFIENSQVNYEKRGILLSVADLKYIAQYEDKLFLSGNLLDFINLSKDDLKKKRKILNRITALSVFVLLIIFSLIFIYFYKQSVYNNAKGLIMSSLSETTDPIDAYLYAIQGDKEMNRSVSKRALFKSFYDLVEQKTRETGKNPLSTIFNFKPCNSEIIEASFSKDGNFIYGYLADSTIIIWKKDGSKLKEIKFPERIILLNMSDDHNYIGVVGKSGNAFVYNFNGQKLFGFKTSFDSLNVKDIISFETKRGQIAAISIENKINVYDLKDGRLIQSIKGHTGEVTSVCFSPDERFLVSASKDKTVHVWYFNRNKSVYSEYSVIKGHKDIVWSAQFNDSSNYILTASADSSVRMWKVTGEPHDFIRSEEMDFTMNHFSPVNRACFTKTPLVLLISRYATRKIKELPDYTMNRNFNQTTKQVKSTKGPGIYQWLSASYYFQFFSSLELDTLMDGFDISPFSFYQAATSKIDTATIFTNSQGTYLKIMRFPGKNPLFSPDGNYLLTINNNRIYLFPCNERELYKLVYVKKIFGEIKKE